MLNIINKLQKLPAQQYGAVLLVMLVILIMGGTAMLLSSLNSVTLKLARDRITADALALAKEALIGRAVADDNHPGSLPCPDNHVPDSPLEGTSSTPCSGNVLGRLPWKTLGLNDLRDGTGERLWYTLSPNFADSTSNKVNSKSNGTLLVYDSSGTTLLTLPGSEAVAIVFAPGGIVGTQQRNSDADKTTASNYLDIGPNSINNSVTAGPFIASNKTNSYNDHSIIITVGNIMPIVEMRVTKELSKAFATYMTNNGNKYPNPANFNSCTSTSCSSDTSQCIGKVPVSTMASVLTSMTWFKDKEWFDVVYYAAGTNSLAAGGAGTGWGGGKPKKGKKGGGSWTGGGGSGTTACTATPAFLSILDTNGVMISSSASALFLMPDSSLSGATRSSMVTGNLADYFEDTENKNLDAVYVLPGGTSNDILNILP